jgi:nitroreductase
MKKVFTMAIAFAVAIICAQAQNVQLPQPQKKGGKPLMEALNDRKSAREFSPKELDNQTLSNLLWAAWGYNRETKRTAPTANDKQEYSLYVVLKAGAYLYDAKNNLLQLVVNQDLRSLTGKQDFVATAPLNLVYVYNKTIATDSKYAYVDCGFISQNVYLFCASAKLNTVVRGFVPYEELSKALNLEPDLEIVLSQTVGYPK